MPRAPGLLDRPPPEPRHRRDDEPGGDETGMAAVLVKSVAQVRPGIERPAPTLLGPTRTCASSVPKV